eukprot:655531-Pelagomonas_calceolata.AAC.13
MLPLILRCAERMPDCASVTQYAERMPDHASAFLRRLEPWLADKLQSKSGAELQRKREQPLMKCRTRMCPRACLRHVGLRAVRFCTWKD